MLFDRLTRRRRVALATILICTLIEAAPLYAEPLLSLEFISGKKIGQFSSGFSEPSGLAIAKATGEFWVVSDDTPAVFRLAPEAPDTIVSLPIKENEMEAVTLAEDEGHFYTLNESKGRITRFSMADGQRLTRQKFRSMAGYARIRDNIKAAGKKNGFEGIAWHSGKHSLFTVLQGPPGLLVEISADLKTVLSSTSLTEANGFINPHNSRASVDFSGLSYDAKRERLWILSDKAARVFLFDLETSKVTQSLPLRWLNHKGKRKTVKQAEGIDLSPDGTQLYVVSDGKSRLYQWRIRQQ